MITKNYIKMCEKNEDLQKEHEWEKNDMYIVKGYGKEKPSLYDSTKFNLEAAGLSLKELVMSFIYLPTQEQLQEMILQLYTPFAKVNKFRDFVLYKSGLNPYAKNSVNELWLMFVMKEKYHKIWTGKEWVIQK